MPWNPEGISSKAKLLSNVEEASIGLNGAIYSEISWRSCALCSPCVTWWSFGWQPVVLLMVRGFVCSYCLWGLPIEQSCATGEWTLAAHLQKNLDLMAAALCYTRAWPDVLPQRYHYIRVASISTALFGYLSGAQPRLEVWKNLRNDDFRRKGDAVPFISVKFLRVLTCSRALLHIPFKHSLLNG